MNLKNITPWKSIFSSRSPPEISFEISGRTWCYPLKIEFFRKITPWNVRVHVMLRFKFDLFIKITPRIFVKNIRAHLMLRFENISFHQYRPHKFRLKISGRTWFLLSESCHFHQDRPTASSFKISGVREFILRKLPFSSRSPLNVCFDKIQRPATRKVCVLCTIQITQDLQCNDPLSQHS